MGLFNKKDKYEVDAKENVPQFAYGIPDAMRKKWEQKAKEENGKNIFSAFEGGHFGPSYYYFVNKINNNYQFRVGYSNNGRIVNNDINDPNIHSIDQNKYHYDKFIDELLKEVKDWKESYNNNQIMDGTQWNIDFVERNKRYSGSNEFPPNYKEVVKILNVYFNVKSLIKDDKIQKYDINPENNIPQRVYGVPNIVDINSRKCPYCGSTELWKYLYGEPTSEYDKDKYILGGCKITGNQPTHKCKKCNKDIYPEKSCFKPNDTI